MRDTIEQAWSMVNAWLAAQPVLGALIGASTLGLVALLANFVAQRQLLRLIRKATAATRTRWDDLIVEEKVFHRLAQVVPALVIYFGIHLVSGLSDGVTSLVRQVALGYSFFIVMLAGGAALTAMNRIYERYPIARDKPIKGYVQLAKILLYIVGTMLVISVLIDRSPLLMLSGFGAMTAILLLVFKDTILSLVASVQLTGLDMVRVGDWIEMPEYSADGDVIDVALHTVRVQNWDKTITTIPTHKLIAESFRNWRGMSESGGRRIKRSIHLDMTSARFLSEDEIARFKKFALLREYVEGKERALAEHNELLHSDGADPVNMRRLAPNVGTFRAYLEQYLRTHAKVHQKMTLLVRQLAPGPEGLPIEVYAFSNDTNWANYEAIQADVFDHLLAILPEFGLRVFQQPTGADLQLLGQR